MTAAAPLATVGALLGDPTRAEMLGVLLDGRARTVGELARHAGVARSTASEHLGRLLDGGLVVVEAQGRHRYHRLAGTRVALMLESIVGLASTTVAVGVRAPAALAFARTCYDHMAGTVAVALYDGLVERQAMVVDERGPMLTADGVGLVAGLGVDADGLATPSRPLVRACLDWTERRHHLAGALGAGLLDAFVRRRWVVRHPASRSLDITPAGRRALASDLGLDVSRLGRSPP